MKITKKIKWKGLLGRLMTIIWNAYIGGFK